MAISIWFPDGTHREVPGCLRKCAISAEGQAAIFEQIPLNCDPFWRYQKVDGQWIALPRTAKVATFVRPVAEWWRSIEPMLDDSSATQSSVAA